MDAGRYFMRNAKNKKFRLSGGEEWTEVFWAM